MQLVHGPKSHDSQVKNHDPEDGLAPGTRWEDIPDEWVCPDCGVSKFDFELIEE